MKARNLILTALFAALTAIGAFIRIPFAFSSITLQFFQLWNCYCKKLHNNR